METQVLSIEQMQELIQFGIDDSNASMFWYIDGKFKQLIPCSEENTIKNWTDQHGEDHIIPAFTLQDILKMLPNTLEFQDVYGNTHFEYIEFWGDGWNQMAIIDPMHPSSPRITTSNINPLRAAFEMLKWCKQNNYV